MKLGNILQAITTGMVKGNLDKEISGIQMDSRQIKEGDLLSPSRVHRLTDMLTSEKQSKRVRQP